jgi:hypothetical protein
LNWALGLKELGCRVLWAEPYRADNTADLIRNVTMLKTRLAAYGFDDALTLLPWDLGATAPALDLDSCSGLDEASEADLVLNFVYSLPPWLVARFRRSALVDIDPGLLQHWMKHNQITVAPHDLYFTIGENVGVPGTRIADLGLAWIHSPPCVSLDWWDPSPCTYDAAFTTVTHWWQDWMADETGTSPNDKRAAFRPYLHVPKMTNLPLELATNLGENEDAEERAELERHGWRICSSMDVAGTPESYRGYVRQSRGEFSCAKPWYVQLATAWISDRTLCYLASSKPAVVQHTGPSRFLPEREGVLRFRTPGEAAALLDVAARHYDEQAEAARALAERHFEARKVVGRVLDAALG